MSALPQACATFDFESYLSWEAEQSERHEFIAGEVFAMTGARSTHNTIAGNLYVALRQSLRGTPCRTHIEGVKVRIEAADASVYPDVFVTCDAADIGPQGEAFKTAPRFVAEVLSDSTGAYDRGRKFEMYQQLPSLQEYLLIEQDRVHADLFRRNEQGLWVLHPAGPGAVVRLDSLDLSLPIEALYEDTASAAGAVAAGDSPTP